MRALLLVRNGVSHDARVLRAARVAERALGGKALVVGVATAAVPAGETTVEGVRVLRLPARTRRQPAPVPEGAGIHSSSPSPGRPPGRPPGRLTWRARAGRILSGAAFAWQALAVACRERPTLVHANDWNTMWCAVAIKLVCRARLVYDSHELWADRNGRWEWRWWLLASEALFVRMADVVITASPGYADALGARYRVGHPTVIRNIPDGPPASASEPQAPPLAVYVGGLIPGRGLEQTIDALALAPAIRLLAIGPGAPEYRASLIERATAAGVAGRVELQPAVPPAQVLAALAGATAGLCLIQPVCRSYELTLPNKLFEYAAAGVPVLASDLPVMASVVRESGIGEVVAATDPRAIAAGLALLCEPAVWSAAATRTIAFTATHAWEREAEILGEIYTSAATGSTAMPASSGSGRSTDSPVVHSAV